MAYTVEEEAAICGMLSLYLERSSVDQAVREKHRKFQRGVAQKSLQREDYRWAEMALRFLKPFCWQAHEDHRALENALLKTHLLAEKQQ